MSSNTPGTPLPSVFPVFRIFRSRTSPLSVVTAGLYALQKHRTTINRNANFSRRKNGICNADFAKKQDLACMIANAISNEYNTFAQDNLLAAPSRFLVHTAPSAGLSETAT